MKKACKYCGKVHERDFECPHKPEQSRISEADKFHYTSQWKEKSLHIRKRDLFLCVACRANLRGWRLLFLCGMCYPAPDIS